MVSRWGKIAAILWTCLSLPAFAQQPPSEPAPSGLGEIPSVLVGPLGGERPEIGFRGCVDSKCSSEWEEEQIRRELAAMIAASLEAQLRGGLPADCTAAKCIREQLEEFPSFSNTPSLAVIKCEAAVCTTIEDPIVPNWRLWEIMNYSGGNPFKGCKDAMCIAPQGRVMGPDADSDEELKRLQEAEALAEEERERARQAAARAKAAEEDAKRKRLAKQAADDAAEEARAAEATARKESAQEARRLKAQEAEDRAYALKQEAQQEEIERRQQAVEAQRAENQAQWEAAEQRRMDAEARAEAADQAQEEARDRAAARADDARRASDSARMATQVFMSELGRYPYLSTYMMACRGAGTGCVEPTGVQGGNRPEPKKKR